MSKKKRQLQRPDLKRRPSNARNASADEVLEAAKDAHRAGELDRARQGYRRILSTNPRHPDALHLLGFAEFQSSRFESAIDLMRSALSIRPDCAEYHNNLALACLANLKLDDGRRHADEARRHGHSDGHGYLHVGIMLFEQRQLECAEAAIHIGLEMSPTSAEGHNYLGILHAVRNNHAEAETCFRRALERNPEYVEALNNLGNALRDQDRGVEAIPWYRQALELSPGFAAAHNNLGVALAKDGHPAEAIACYERALRLQPRFPEALNNLGNAYRDLGRRAEAIECLRQALTLQPGSAEIQSNLGVALRQNGDVQQAIAYFRRAVVVNPSSTEILGHLASALVEWGDIDKASACFRHLEQLDPQQPLRKLSAATLRPAVFSLRQEMEEYRDAISRTIATVAPLEYPLNLADFTHFTVPAPFNWQFLDGNIRELKQAYAEIFDKRLAAAYHPTWIDSRHISRTRIRVGFIVTDGHEGIFLKSLRGIISRMSAKDFELIIFCSFQGRAQIQAAFPHEDVRLVPLPNRFDHIARAIDAQLCDVLYYWEVGTDVTNYFLPFLRLAPIQLTSWGIQVTSGIRQLDYYVSNQLVEADEADAHYTERLVRAKTFLTYRQRTPVPESLRPRDQFPLPANSHWYVCAQQSGKFHIDFDDMLAGILRADPGGLVAVTGDKYGRQASLLRQRFQANMPDVTDRIHILPRLDTAEYMSLLSHAEVLLDPPHFGGVNSSYDGFSIGKAIVVLPSAFHRGRYTLGCYRKMAISDCVAANADEFVRIAVRLASDQDYRHDVERRITQASNVLFDDDNAVREHERIFGELVSRTQR